MVSVASPSAAVVGPTPSHWTQRARRPLAATAAALIAIDLMGLGLHLADANNDARTAEPAPQARARTTVTAPNAVVDSSTVEAAAGSNRTRTTTSSGAMIGPVAPPVVATPSPNTPTTPNPTPTPAVPLLQTNIAVPALGVQASLGLGDGSCTTVDLTLLALGNCPAPEGEGAVILQLGGSLLGS